MALVFTKNPAADDRSSTRADWPPAAPGNGRTGRQTIRSLLVMRAAGNSKPGPLDAPARLSNRSALALAEAIDARWAALCEVHAPRLEGAWRHHVPSRGLRARQGWKIHLSATLLSAVDLFERSAATLSGSGLAFKVAASLDAMRWLANGLDFGRSQVGKMITVYCPDPRQARSLAEQLHACTIGVPGPRVPSDLQFRPGSAVYYRYGSYAERLAEIDGRQVPVYLDPAGEPVADRRTRSTAVPPWASNPFIESGAAEPDSAVPRTRARYRATRMLGWRGRGGVYLAEEAGGDAPRWVVLKEALSNGGIDLDGRSAELQLRGEMRCLATLGTIIPVPTVVEYFRQDGCGYLVLERIAGRSIDELIHDDALSWVARFAIAHQMVDIVSRLHASGWAWRDCKPQNFMLEGARVRPIDFETAIRLRGRPALFMSTKGYFLESKLVSSGKQAEQQDLYALGVTLHRLFAGCSDRQVFYPAALAGLPDAVPRVVREAIDALKNPVPRERPPARIVKQAFESIGHGGEPRAANQAAVKPASPAPPPPPSGRSAAAQST